MKTITIDIVNEQVMKLFHELEALRFIRIRDKTKQAESGGIVRQMKGSLSRQSPDQLDNELNRLREGWD